MVAINKGLERERIRWTKDIEEEEREGDGIEEVDGADKEEDGEGR